MTKKCKMAWKAGWEGWYVGGWVVWWVEGKAAIWIAYVNWKNFKPEPGQCAFNEVKLIAKKNIFSASFYSQQVKSRGIGISSKLFILSGIVNCPNTQIVSARAGR
jgi:hypothetical protein